VRALLDTGVGKQLIDKSVVLTRVTTLNAAGKILRHEEAHPDRRAPGLGVHRNTLLEALLDGINAEIRLGVSVRGIEQRAEQVWVDFDNGASGVFDLVVGADGLNSRVRQLLFNSSPPCFREINAWRVLVPLRPGGEPYRLSLEEEGRIFGAFPVTPELLYLFVLVPGFMPRGISQAMHLQRMKEVTSDFGGVLRDIVEQVVNPDELFFAPVYEVEMERWHRGHVVLIGDAAHAMVPFLAKGAAMAIEDAVVLAQALGHFPALEDAIYHYEQIRQPRVNEVRAIVRAYGIIRGLLGTFSEEELARHRQLVADPAWYRRRLLNLPNAS
jgi:2-polyprenyl-6-methoxyphenol hydroxylase-like FAD-dependent oxidoreductase